VSAAPAVTVQNLVKKYGHLVAVDDVSLSIHEGEIFGIIGPNGAGKTTTVECISGLRAPDSGSIIVCGLSPRKDRNKIRAFVGVQASIVELFAFGLVLVALVPTQAVAQPVLLAQRRRRKGCARFDSLFPLGVAHWRSPRVQSGELRALCAAAICQKSPGASSA
jgi:ABC-type branched-subunit amino acid transport system ATPase component